MREVEFKSESFRLEGLQAHDVMEKEVIFCREHISCRDAADILLSQGCGCLPVVDSQRRLLGVITEYDLLRVVQQGADLGEESLDQWMVTDVSTVSPGSAMIEVMEKLEGQRHMRLPVVEDERLVGIVSRRDVLFAVLKGGATYFKIP